MKKQTVSFIYPFLLLGVLLIFANSCKKDKDNNNNNPANTFTDPRDGNVYKTVTIGTQVWMAENLRYLPSVVGPSTGSSETPCYYVYGYYGTSITEAKAAGNYNTYGVLYNWTATMNACPAGWHLPSDEEWSQLILYVGDPAGDKLKESGILHWASLNAGATNTTGFTALPGGSRYGDGTFSGIGDFGIWWSATESTESNNYAAWARYMEYDSSNVTRDDSAKHAGHSVRCVRD
jgi:uncharacterized protein (TIGR02145 family)